MDPELATVRDGTGDDDEFVAASFEQTRLDIGRSTNVWALRSPTRRD